MGHISIAAVDNPQFASVGSATEKTHTNGRLVAASWQQASLDTGRRQRPVGMQAVSVSTHRQQHPPANAEGPTRGRQQWAAARPDPGPPRGAVTLSGRTPCVCVCARARVCPG